MKQMVLLLFSLAMFSPLLSVTAQQRPGDSARMAPSDQYLPASIFRKILIGTNYRKEWSTPVTLPVLDLKATGLTIVKLGGGQQTKSLRLKDAAGREWALRTVDKDAAGAVPENLRKTLAHKVVQDMISGAHPYAAVTVGALAEVAGIPAPRPRLYYVPLDPALAPYSEVFANSICMLEQREVAPAIDTDDSEDLLDDMFDKNKLRIDQQKVLRVRLLDLLVADWDRHEGQYIWGERDSADRKFYYPIALDRDQAFFNSNGLIPALAKIVVMQHIDRFNYSGRNLRRLASKTWEFDRLFLNATTRKDWETAIAELQGKWTDAAIESAVRELPREVYELSGAVIEKKLKGRRDRLHKSAMNYYEFLAGQVFVPGSNDTEVFQLEGDADSLQLTVQRLNKHGKGEVVYRRSFYPGETGTLRISGLQGNDQFVVNVKERNRIRVEVHGDEGEDRFDIKSVSRIKLFDIEGEKNEISEKGNTRVILTEATAKK